jgi:hypothetical protein
LLLAEIETLHSTPIFRLFISVSAFNFRVEKDWARKGGMMPPPPTPPPRILLPHEPFAAKIRAILVQTIRSTKYAFGAALHTTPFDRVNGDI